MGRTDFVSSFDFSCAIEIGAVAEGQTSVAQYIRSEKPS